MNTDLANWKVPQISHETESNEKKYIRKQNGYYFFSEINSMSLDSGIDWFVVIMPNII